ncbi:DUF350 domain-containing protein [Zavarzinia compransoris]|uniref:DUF350 domain-containing protein n=1 Tax=Zavarzinia compransoris TaxID=1264899 RepID=A0A317EBK9_9PROT|nr:DUF350 domain-containing protein [Zavarzinia compransoris]PWR23520.1 DUF350 domain-containing protein [Zavarzinia compransoris]TDP47730.1 uncharacterized protein DUF350 [Zavarzinia compransoris]
MEFIELIQAKYVVGAIAYSALGTVILVLAFVILDLLTPKVSVWRELVEKQNLAFAVFLGAVAIGISIIISAAIQG